MPIHGYPGGVITANPVAPTSTVATGVWTTEQQLQATSAGNWPRPGPPQPISRSLRFNSADSTYLNRTPASTGNQTAWTWSAWVKRSTIETSRENVYAINNSNRISFSNDDSSQNLVFEVYNGSGADYFMQTAAVYRDPSAWYHIVAVWDSNNGTSADRQRLYVNGVRITAFAASGNSIPSGATSNNWNTTSANNIGRSPVTANYFSGYLTELYFIDGQALTPSSFGQTNASTGVWEPIPYTGTYGTNGFYLNFSDNSGTTSTTLGKDSSGNGNNWTPNNFSVTAGVGNDSLVDSPTSYGTDTGVGGEVRGNYCTWNPLYGSTPTLTNGNLDATTNNTTAYGSISFTSGKWYWEITVGNANYIGVMDSTYIKTDNNWGSQAIAYVSNGNKYNGTGSAYGASYTTNDVIGVAIDMDAGTIAFYKNGSSQGTAFSSGLAGREFRPLVYSPTSGTQTANFGQRAFAYTAPSGFKALCTQNLPTPTIGATSTTQANRYMDIKLYTGNGGQQTQTGLNFQPDFIWVKSRNNAYNNGLANAVTGTGKYLVSNSTAAEVTDASGSIIAFNANGFGQGGSNPFGANAATYVAWCWRASNAAGVTNTAGTITSTVSANTTSGFSIVTYTGNGSAGATVGHGLGVTPDMIIVKSRSVGTGDWVVWHSSLTSSNNNYLILNSTAAVNTANQPWNNTLPTSSVFSLRTWDSVNQNGSTYVAYCFDAVAGYSAFGSYTGNGSSDGPFVYTGFRPMFILFKQSSASGNDWYIYDAVRSTYNVATNRLFPNSSAAEATNFNTLDILSNGWKVRDSNSAWNASGATYIYACFAESPFKYSLAR